MRMSPIEADVPTNVGGAPGNEIWVNEFNEKSAQEFRAQVLLRADREGTNIIPIYIDSYGGQVDALAKMLATMDEVPNRFITICMGKAVSCGAVLLSHGDLRFCDKYSRVMVHNVLTGSYGDVTTIQSTADEVVRLNKLFLGLLAKNCGMTYDQLQKKIKDTTDSKDIWMGAEDAKKFGIVDEIGVPDIIPVIQFAIEARPTKERINTKKQATSKKSAKKR